MPLVLVAQAELPRRGDHAVRDVAVGLARGDREWAGQHTARAAHDDQVAGDEVVGTADDAAHAGPLASPTSTWHQWMVLPLVCGSSTNSTHLADDDQGRSRRRRETSSSSKPDPHERGEDVLVA